MAASAWIGLSHWMDGRQTLAIAATFAVGAGLSFPMALLVTWLLSRKGRWHRRFITAFFALGLCTSLATAVLFALQHHASDVARHEDVLAHALGMPALYNVAGAAYLFAVIGLRLYWPLGVAGLAGASLWFALRSR